MRLLGLAACPPTLSHFGRLRFAILTVAGVGSFAALAVAGGGHALWLSNPRAAYQFYRTGAGPFFLLTQYLTVFALGYLLWTARPRALGTAAVALMFVVVSWFSGCKEQMAAVLLLPTAYYHFRVARLPGVLISLIGACAALALAAVLYLDVAQGGLDVWPDGLSFSLFSYFDFLPNTALYISHASEVGPQHGAAALSALWGFAPRLLFPSKPYEYGVLTINGLLFPGLAERTHTPAFLDWALWHLDFGAEGVFAAALVEGFAMRGAFDYYLDNRANLYAFECALQFGCFPIFVLASPPMFLGILLAQRLALRVRWDRRPTEL